MLLALAAAPILNEERSSILSEISQHTREDREGCRTTSELANVAGHFQPTDNLDRFLFAEQYAKVLEELIWRPSVMENVYNMHTKMLPTFGTSSDVSWIYPVIQETVEFAPYSDSDSVSEAGYWAPFFSHTLHNAFKWNPSD